MSKYLYLFFSMCLFDASSAIAQDSIASSDSAAHCTDLSGSIFFGNGVLNSQKDAAKSARELRSYLRTQFRQNPRIVSYFDNFKNVKLSNNLSESAIRDVIQARNQKREEASSSIWKYLSDWDSAPVWFQSLMADIYVFRDRNQLISDSDLQRHYSSYRETLSKPHETITLIAHSQGNFYAN
jgi:hypothetical protein